MHEVHELLPLILSLTALAAGPFVYRAAERARTVVVVLHVGLVVAILALVVFEILPECVEAAGLTALLVAGLGLLGPVLAERGLRGAGHGAHRAVVMFALLALVLHGFTDGVALVAGHEHHEHAHGEGVGFGLVLAMLLHRLPEGAALWWLMRARGAASAMLAIGSVAAATIAGFAFGETALPALDAAGVALLQAFVAGVLLHVIVHHREAPRLEAAPALH